MAAITIHLPHAVLERAKARSSGHSLDEVIEAGRVVDVAHVNARIEEVLRKVQG